MQDDTTVQDPAGMPADDNGDTNTPVVPTEVPVETPANEGTVETPATGETPVEGNPEETPNPDVNQGGVTQE